MIDREPMTEQLVLRVTPALRRAAEEAAAEQRRTVADTLRIIIGDALTARPAADKHAA